jgi:hypothetical protein
MSFSYSYGQQQIGDNLKCRQIAGNFDCRADAAVQRGVHRPIEHNQGFLQSHWMLPSSECLCHIARRPPLLTNLVENTKHYQKLF